MYPTTNQEDINRQRGLVLISAQSCRQLDDAPLTRDVEMADFIIDQSGRCLKNRYGRTYDFQVDRDSANFEKRLIFMVIALGSSQLFQFVIWFLS